MADDHRYSWLDDKAAERLLRGEPVDGRHGAPDGRNDRPHAEAERLAAVLGAVAEEARHPDTAAAPGGRAPLPGEEAAVAAFRAARTQPTVVAISAEGLVGGKSTRIARPAVTAPGAAAPAGRQRGWRGLRAGMVAAVAGCALSGFAVAAAAGVLPFGHGGGTPSPGASVSETGPEGGESARPEISQDGGGPTSPDETGGGTSEGTQGRGVPGGGEGHGKHGRHDKHGKHHGHDKPGKQGKGAKGTPEAWKTGTGNALGACRRYLAAEAGTGPDVGKGTLKKLERAAGSRSGIHGYCVGLVGGDTVPDGGTGGGTDGTSTTSSGTGSTSGDDGGSSGPAPPPPAGDDAGTPSPDPTSSDTPSSTLAGTPSGTPSSGSSASQSTTSSDPTAPTESSAP